MSRQILHPPYANTLQKARNARKRETALIDALKRVYSAENINDVLSPSNPFMKLFKGHG